MIFFYLTHILNVIYIYLYYKRKHELHNMAHVVFSRILTIQKVPLLSKGSHSTLEYLSLFINHFDTHGVTESDRI